MEEEPERTDHTVTNARTSAKEKIPRKCGCGQEKTTTLRGLHIHMGKKKCGNATRMQPCTALERAGQKGRREKEIDDLVASRRQLYKWCMKAEESEKEGLKALWNEIRRRLANLQRAERFRNPFRHARRLLEKKTSGTLDVSKEKLEEHIRAQYSDPARNKPLGSPGYVPRPPEPSAPFDTSPPKLSKVRQVIQRERIPYRVYKNCPRVLKS